MNLDQLNTARVNALAKLEVLETELKHIAKRTKNEGESPGLVDRGTRTLKAVKSAKAEYEAAESAWKSAVLQGFHDGTVHGEPAVGPLDGATVKGGRANGPEMLKAADSTTDWLAAQGVKRFDEDYALGYLGAQFKALMGEPDDLVEYRSHLPASMKDMTTSGASVLIPTPIAAMLIDRLRAATTVLESGATTVPMTSSTLKVPRITADPTPTWKAEGAEVTATDANVDGVVLTARRLTALTRVSQELAEDSNPVSVGRVLAISMARSFATELDRVALVGTGTAPEPRGVLNTPGIQGITAVGPASWDDLADLHAAVAGVNAQPNGFIWSTRTANAVGKSKASGSGEYLTPPAHIAELPRRATTAVPVDGGAGTDESLIFCADWTQLMIGIRIGFEMRTLVERYAEFGQLGVIARLRADVALQHAPAFAVASGVTN